MEMQHSFPNSTGCNSSSKANVHNSSIFSTPTNAVYDNYYIGDTWPMLEGLTHLPPSAYPLVPDEPLQMMHLRFPTPPITPPYIATTGSEIILETTTKASNGASIEAALNTPTAQTRTQTVIMKISTQDLCPQQAPQHSEDNLSGIDIVNLHSLVTNKFIGHSRLHDSQQFKRSSANLSPKPAEHICEWRDCGRDHHSLETLATHVTKVHAVASTADGLYYCRWRGCTRTRGFSARYKMLVHARTHTKEKPHQCHLCSKCFSRAENLKIHIRSHSGEKPYLCTYQGCHKAYSNSSDRFKHTRTHAMEKPYLCKVPGCQKRYTDPSSLRKHVKTFKHALQLIDTTAVTPVNDDNAATPTTPELEATATATATPLPNVTPKKHGKPNAEHYHSQEGVINGYQLYENTDITAPATLPVPLLETVPLPMAVCQLCAQPDATTQLPHYYLHGTEDDFCHIKATQLDYYYTSPTRMAPQRSMNATNYWLSHMKLNENSKSTMDSEAPLDLRVNRN